MQFINQYSSIWIAGILVILFGIILLRHKPTWQKGIAFCSLVLGLFVAWVLLHPQQSAQGLDAAQVQASIGQGTPVLLELQSPF